MPSFKLIYVLILIKMKRNVFIIAFLAMSFMAMAQQWTGLGSNTPTSPQIRLISSSEQQIIVDFTLKGFNMTKVSTPNGIQQIITVPKMASMLETGAPDLPQFPIPAIIGDRAEMKVSVTRSDSLTMRTSKSLLQKATSAVRLTLKACLTLMEKCTTKMLSILPSRLTWNHHTLSVISVARISW